jgi:hypothetical protein
VKAGYLKEWFNNDVCHSCSMQPLIIDREKGGEGTSDV